MNKKIRLIVCILAFGAIFIVIHGSMFSGPDEGMWTFDNPPLKQLKDRYNFTLRLSYGTIEGYPMNGTIAPSKTTFYGLYERAVSFDMKQPFDFPARYRERKEKLDLSTPLNFVSTCVIIGGKSGSPVIDRYGDLVGLIFDGNIESLVGNFIYTVEANRAVAVHSAVMIEALQKLYDAGKLTKELEGKSK